MDFFNKGKDLSSASCYRPIALRGCLCKLFKKMVKRSLVYSLEYNGLLMSFQVAFRPDLYTNDQLVALESCIKDAFVHKQYFLGVFLHLDIL